MKIPDELIVDWAVSIERVGYGRAVFSVISYGDIVAMTGYGGEGTDGILTAIDGDKTHITLIKTVDPVALAFLALLELASLIVLAVTLITSDETSLLAGMITALGAVVFFFILVFTPLQAVSRALKGLLQAGGSPIYHSDPRKGKRSHAGFRDDGDDWRDDTPLL